ncbi:MAG TPA: hypothetical protein DDX39_08345 [Bacteroidales bacterium]|nr:MAG: hypothetical protein A2W98_09870 [Bacteroidetes bacterium GWF2_33_38]OFY90936.1 MAG: hypothetical protein A2236_09840 [Bacteroidetes bacterium RIFOXYA2_FULL_33_7]HBF88636.1 hypothetical protein [Bacteroidales bacterium]
MGKHRYTKADLEMIVYKQLENLNAMGEQIKLLEEQNLMLVKFNQKLMGLVSENLKEAMPYPVLKRPANKNKKSEGYLQVAE